MTNSFFMRGALSIALSIFAISNLSAQNVTYKVIADEPKLDPFVIVNLDLFQLDMGVNNLDGTSFNTGLWGIVQPVSRIGIDYNFKCLSVSLPVERK